MNRSGAFVLAIAAACATAVTQPSLPLWGELKPGPYDVGFRSGDEWYPASADGQRMRYRDYAGELDELEKSLHEQNVSDAAMVELFDSPMFARRDAPPLTDKFPLVYIVRRSNQTAADLAVVAEFLASHGYAVRVVDAKAKTDPAAQFLHAANVSATTLLSPDKSQLASMANGFLKYLQSSQRAR